MYSASEDNDDDGISYDFLASMVGGQNQQQEEEQQVELNEIQKLYESRAISWEIAREISLVSLEISSLISIFFFLRLIGASLFSGVLVAILILFSVVGMVFYLDILPRNYRARSVLFLMSLILSLAVAERDSVWDWVRYHGDAILKVGSIAAISFVAISVAGGWLRYTLTKEKR